jgi:serine/threonine protein kinase
LIELFHFVDKWKEALTQGGSGSISIVEHIASGRILVWKQVFLGTGAVNKVKEEVEIGMKLKSQYVVPILDWFIEEGFLYIVMEYYSGGTLGTVVKKLKESGTLISENVLLFIFMMMLI